MMNEWFRTSSTVFMSTLNEWFVVALIQQDCIQPLQFYPIANAKGGKGVCLLSNSSERATFSCYMLPESTEKIGTFSFSIYL